MLWPKLKICQDEVLSAATICAREDQGLAKKTIQELYSVPNSESFDFINIH